jgi:hypothetical protein
MAGCGCVASVAYGFGAGGEPVLQVFVPELVDGACLAQDAFLVGVVKKAQASEGVRPCGDALAAQVIRPGQKHDRHQSQRNFGLKAAGRGLQRAGIEPFPRLQS